MNLCQQTAIAVATFCALSALSSPADAVPLQREQTANATAICQSALPVFDTAIRKRPLALQNEGTQTAFVTCNFITESAYGGGTGTDGFEVVVSNTSGSSKDVTCTAVVGNAFAVPAYFTITKTIAHNNGAGFAVTSGANNAGVPFDANLPVSFNCALPPGTALNQTWVWYKQDVPVASAP